METRKLIYRIRTIETRKLVSRIPDNGNKKTSF
jgi:hypothetical protein